MKKYILMLLIPAMVSIHASGSKGISPLRDLKECSPRGGLPNFFNKLKKNKELKVAYFGGSVTDQRGWRVFSLNWLQKQFPQAKIEEINAAIGGTDSGLGVFRLDHDVLRFKPDLIFIEFAINDSKMSSIDIEKSFEGIIRKTWRKLPECDICFVYTLTGRDQKTLFRGKMSPTASVMERIADHYNIPTIHMGVEIAELAKKGKLVFRGAKGTMTRVSGKELNENAEIPVNKNGKIAFTGDGTHPYINTGHKLYMAAIARSLPIIEKSGKPDPHKLPKAMGTNWEHAEMLPLSQGALSKSGWQRMPRKSPLSKFNKRMPQIWKAAPGATLEFKFKGVKLGIYDIIGPDCGCLEITVDGKKEKVMRIDGYCTYYRPSHLQIADKLPDKIHTVKIKVLNDKIDKSQILHKKNREDFKKNPAKYDGANWYPGAIFVVGELINN